MKQSIFPALKTLKGNGQNVYEEFQVLKCYNLDNMGNAWI